MNKELQDANEELQATNEELMLTQEELQATNEEFEATNEELQATNEELETNNEELQATNEELQTTNDELTARTFELQDFTRQHKFEQLQLSALLERFPHYVMVVNAHDLIIETINPGYKATAWRPRSNWSSHQRGIQRQGSRALTQRSQNSSAGRRIHHNDTNKSKCCRRHRTRLRAGLFTL